MSPIDQLNTLLTQNHLWETETVYKRNAYLITKGNQDASVFFIVDGSVRVYTIDKEDENTIRFGYKNSFVTAIDCFFTDNPTQFYIQALKKTTVKVISKKILLDFIQSDKQLLQLWNTILGQLIIQQMERERDLLMTSPVDRYKSVLKRSPQVFQEIPDKYIASYLRMTAETLSRIKKS
ncbi:Crp/Fnr family transcriptional regulator [Flavobacterium cerinum]|uniref:Crp/Fnr family transcriptional regulator n=1 Tax=Flavobacterium cerinum TaxID=2502784 RepID=A0ABY5IP73_9FLAO|nr:Crp/Fnr family transcriptional regulator [Flavobacterium cerinum]UUC44633.1 Crp/Fnr family transcriptional regulator [Flavobacterium cerinum]